MPPNLVWLQKFGGGTDNHAIGNGVAIDSLGNVYITGTLPAKSFNQTKLTSAGELDSFIAKFDPAGKLSWVKQAGGKNCFCESYAIAADKKGAFISRVIFVGKAAFGNDNMISRSGMEPGHDWMFSSNMILRPATWSGCIKLEKPVKIPAAFAVDDHDNVYVTGRFPAGREFMSKEKGEDIHQLRQRKNHPDGKH